MNNKKSQSNISNKKTSVLHKATRSIDSKTTRKNEDNLAPCSKRQESKHFSVLF